MLDDIKKLEEKIAKLPKGYISYKKINGKERHYLQWVENGKIKSKYIPDIEFEGLKDDIAYRKQLQERLKSLTSKIKNKCASERYDTNVILGESLYKLVFNATGYESRDVFDNLNAYVFGEVVPKVCIVYGLRRTGKTTAMFQAIAQMKPEDFSKAVFIRIEKDNTMDMLESDLKKLYNHGYRYVFIDEINLLVDFVPNVATMADIYCAMGMKIVLTGTDSFSLWLLTNDELYDRAYLVHTTWISFSEHSKLFNTTDIDEYIGFGGTLKSKESYSENPSFQNEELSFRTEESTEKYIESAVSKNIHESLSYFVNNNQFLPLRVGPIKDLVKEGKTIDAVNYVIRNINRKFVLNALTDKFQLNIAKNVRKTLLSGSNAGVNMVDKISDVDIINRLTQLIKNDENQDDAVKLKDKQIEAIKACLFYLDVVEELPTKYSMEKLRDSDNVLFVQPGMRCSYAKELISLLKEDKILEELSEADRNHICDTILIEIKERMLEEMVLVETKKRLQAKFEVFKYKFAGGEFDMVIMDKENYTCRVFEIEHSKYVSEDQMKYLDNKEECQKLEARFGKITGKYVLYLGDTTRLENGVSYINVYDYIS